jgi:porphobilinogen synthase
MVFPEYRPRRMRRNEALRSLIRETTLSAGQLIYPLFIVPGKKVKKEVSSMPGVHQISVDQLAAEARELQVLGVNSVILFGIPESEE